MRPTTRYLPGLWIAADKALGRPVSAGEPYPHICVRLVDGAVTVSGRPVRLAPRECAACAEERVIPAGDAR